MAEALLFNGAQRTLLVRELAAVADGDVEREDADDAVDDPARHEAGSLASTSKARELTKLFPGRAALTTGDRVSAMCVRVIGLLL